VTGYQGSGEVAQAQFDLAWMTHESKNFAESSKLLTEHLAYYADKNTDNRGRAGYWAARDSERSGKLAEVRHRAFSSQRAIEQDATASNVRLRSMRSNRMLRRE